jgi:hypothetical protein
MDEVNITITIPRRKLDRLLDIGDRPSAETIGTDLEKEFDDLRKDIGHKVIMKYKNSGADPA